MPDKPHRRRAWVWIVAGVAVLVVAPTLVVWEAHRRATAAFEWHAVDVAAKIDSLRSRERRQARVFGEVTPGNGWVPFMAALREFRKIHSAQIDKIPKPFADPAVRPDLAYLDRIYAKYDGHVDALHHALRSRELNPGDPIPVIRVMHVAAFLIGSSAWLHEKGQGAEALDRLLIAFGTAQAVARDGSPIGFMQLAVVERAGAERFRSYLAVPSLRAEDLERFATALDALSRARPSLAEVIEREDISTRELLLHVAQTAGSDRSGSSWTFTEGSWRYLFSERIAIAAALEALREHYRKLEELSASPGGEAWTNAGLLCEKLAARGGPILKYFVPDYGNRIQQDAETRMHWTLMRVATAIAWYQAEKGAFPAALADLQPRYLSTVPACPYTGKPLGYSQGRVWSIGGDGDIERTFLTELKSVFGDDAVKPLVDEGEKDSDGGVVWTVGRKNSAHR